MLTWAAALSAAAYVVVTSSIDPVPTCLRQLEASLHGRRIAADTWRRHTSTLTLDSTVLAQLNAQPEYTQPVWDYLAVMADAERIADGERAMREYRGMLDTIRMRTRVDPAVLIAIWGVESNFGRGAGSRSVLRSLATLACAGRRQPYFRSELLSALRIVAAGDIEPAKFVGSWAGAFGQTQFMPGSFERLAVDFDGDGRRDVISNVGDALASTANYLKHSGWRADEPWGVEVRVPVLEFATMRSDARTAGYVIPKRSKVRRSLAEWTTRGFTLVNGRALGTVLADSTTPAELLMPAGPEGPAFLAFRNFEAVYRYNASVAYTVSILHLADRVRGSAPFVAAWPTNDLGLSRAERRELQTLLAQRGHPVGAPTGALTDATRAAVKAEQQRLGLRVDGRPGQQLLARLRAPTS